jgi:hypothetical protein
VIVTDWFVFLHLHKSGGTFVNEGLKRHVPGARPVGHHLPARLIPPEARGLPVLGLVRNPWSYYVSWYSYQRQRPQPNALFRLASDGGRRDFAATIHRLLDLGRDGALLNRVVAALPAGYGGQGLNLPGFALAPIRDTGLGFYTYLYQYVYGADAPAAQVSRLEDLPDGLLRRLEPTGCPYTADLAGYLRMAPPLNRSDHGDWTAYYDADLRDRVADLDAPVISRHGYAFAS